ncbi:hypothetical protein Tco_0552440, partial [Tanacetum coccineum]
MMESSIKKRMIKVISGVINKIGRLSLGDCMKLVVSHPQTGPGRNTCPRA